MERVYEFNELSGYQVAGFTEYGPSNSGPPLTGARNNEPGPLCIRWLQNGIPVTPYVRVEAGQEHYHPVPGAMNTLVEVSRDLGKC